MDARQERGLAMAARCRILNKAGKWIVPSATGNGTYTVDPVKGKPTCTCPDHETRGIRCKHIWAAAFTARDTAKRQAALPPKPAPKPTYKQDWRSYNKAQTGEKILFQRLLADLCSPLPNWRHKTGRPPVPLADAVFGCAFKVYSTVSGRRFMCDLRDAKAHGFVGTAPHYNTLFTYLDDGEMIEVLLGLIQRSSLPLRAVETNFAVDSSGFATSRFVKWFDHKYGGERKAHDWVKAHICCGVKTNVVTAVEIVGRDAHDAPLLPDLVKTTAANFKIGEVSADKAYSSRNNLAAVAAQGGTAYIPFKTNAVAGAGLWGKMFHYFNFKREEFLNHYHRRSNVESTFSMVKAKFGDAVRSKSDTAMVNEVLCKFLCHNICCVIQEMHELGIAADFGVAA